MRSIILILKNPESPEVSDDLPMASRLWSLERARAVGVPNYESKFWR